MVRAQSAGAHSPAHGGQTAQGNRTSVRRSIHALVIALAAPDARNATLHRSRRAGSVAAVARLRSAGERLGAADIVTAHRGLRSKNFGSTLFQRHGRMGTTVAGGGDG